MGLLIAAFSRLLAREPRARLVLRGAVYEHRWLAGLLSDAGVADRTVLTGQQPPAVVAPAYRAADVFAFPSRTDTQGLVLQEAALAGLPAVMTDATLAAEGPLGGAALLSRAEPEAYAMDLLRLLTDRSAAAALGASAREAASRHTPKRYADAVLAVYAHAAERGAGRVDAELAA